MKNYKITWRFFKGYKIYLALLIIFMILVQFLTMLTPYVISKIIDENVLAITNPWSQVSTCNNNCVEYNDLYYVPTIDVEDSTTIVSDFSILIYKDQFYAVNEAVMITPNSTMEVTTDALIVDQTSYNYTLLSKEDVKNFYSYFTHNLFLLCIFLLFILIFKALFGFAQRMMSSQLYIWTTRDVRSEAIEKLQYVPLDFIEQEPAGKTTNRLLGDSVGPADLFLTTINIVFSSMVGIIFGFMFMFMLDAKLAAICLLILPIIGIWIFYFGRYINKIATNSQETNSKMIGQINEIINGMNVLKIFNQKKETIEDFSQLNDEYVDYAMKEVKTHLLFGWNAMQLFQGLIGAFVLLYFGYRSLHYNVAIEAGVVYAYYNYINNLVTPIGQIFQSFGNIENQKVRVSRIDLLLSQELESSEITEKIKYKGDILFKDVNFGYDANNLVLRNIHMDIKQGQKVGLVGHTGSGKSTLMNLLLRFNDLKPTDSGEIFIDDMDISQFTKRTYRQDIGIILQEPILFSGTVYDNICYSKYLTHKDAEDILISVGGKKLLAKLDKGLDTKVSSKGNNFSLGEKQLISFARIMASNPSIIIMDEATANIDTETEQIIARGLAAIAKNKTFIVIAHRLSTIVDADQIFVLSKGEIIESGIHRDLLKQDGYYANMYRSQAE